MRTATPTPTPSPTGLVQQISDATQKGSTWLDKHGSALVTKSITIAGTIVVALVLRALILRAIGRVVERTANADASRTGRFIEGSLLLAAERRRQRTAAIGSVLRSVTTLVILGIAALTVLSTVGVPMAPILASASVVGVAIGFGARDVVTDFLAGLFMIFEDQYGVGDVVDTGEAKGTVEAVNLRVIQLRDDAGIIWYVRNGQVKRIGNLSQGFGRALVDVPVAYSEDLARAQEIMAATIRELAEDPHWAEMLVDDPRVMGIESFDGETAVVRVQAKTAPQKQFEVARELRVRLKLALDRGGVQVSTLSSSTR